MNKPSFRIPKCTFCVNGKIEETEKQICPKCSGSGKNSDQDFSLLEMPQRNFYKNCQYKDCNGTGKITYSRSVICRHCNGKPTDPW